MKKIKKFEKGIKRKYGRKGYRFYKSVKSEALTAKTAKSVVGSFVSGVKDAKSKIEFKEYEKEIREFRFELIDTTFTIRTFMSACLVINGDIDKEDKRFNEIYEASCKPVEDLIKKINDGKFDKAAEDEDFSEIIERIKYTLFVQSGMTPYEIKVFEKQWELAGSSEE